MTLVLVATVAVLFATGTYLMLQQNLVRIVIGLGFIAHGANILLLLAGGPPGQPPIVGVDGSFNVEAMSDPLPQAMGLTAIVITFAITAFLLAMAYRNWVLHGDDVVEHDLEDRRISADETREDQA